jgi:hypothetical protein
MLNLRAHRAMARMLVPVLVGVAAYWLVTGGAMFAPSNVAWLQHSDLAQSYYGWAFYRRDPWTLPFGASPSYGLDFHSSVYYSDSIPLVAMFFKLFAGWLPATFQYFGLWILICFVLQAHFAIRIISIATPSIVARTLGSILFVLAPPLLMRLGGHMALFGQWPILAALYLYLRPIKQGQRYWWTLLVSASMLIHAYIFVMVVATWVADLIERQRDAAYSLRPGRRFWPSTLHELIQVPLVTALCAWFAGFFMVQSGGWHAEGFGFYKMNVLSILNGGGWSTFGLQFPMTSGEYEGFNYLGAGVLFLLVVAVTLWRKRHSETVSAHRVVWPLVVVGMLLTLFAITNNVGVGGMQWHVTLPAKMQLKLSHSAIQSTGRLFWVPYYALLCGVIFVLARALSTRWLIAVLVVGVVLQLTDLHLGITSLRTMLVARAQSKTAPHLDGPFWTQAAQRYTRVRLVPSRVLAPGWELLAGYAYNHHMATDAIQVARVDWKLFNNARIRQTHLIAEGQPENQTLYVLDADEVAIAAKNLRQGDALFAVDDLNVLAPGWGSSVPKGVIDLRANQPSE